MVFIHRRDAVQRVGIAEAHMNNQTKTAMSDEDHQAQTELVDAAGQKELDSTRAAVTADLMTRPSFMSAHTAMNFIPDSMKAYGPANIASMYAEVRDTVKKVVEGDMTKPEALLMAQAMSLNSIYNECASVAGALLRNNLPQAEVLLRMALKAQAQCTQTLRVLGELKNPKAVAFIKQQNNATNQQVNNGSSAQPAAPAARVHEESPTNANELLDHHHGERLDAGAASEAGRGNQALEAVGAVDRPEVGRG